MSWQVCIVAAVVAINTVWLIVLTSRSSTAPQPEETAIVSYRELVKPGHYTWTIDEDEGTWYWWVEWLEPEYKSYGLSLAFNLPERIAGGECASRVKAERAVRRSLWTAHKDRVCPPVDAMKGGRGEWVPS